MRSVALSIRKEFVEAAHGGASNWRIVRSHVFPHLVGPLIVLATLNVAAFILAEAGLSFLGLGILLPTASWGNLLAEAPKYYLPAAADGAASLRRRSRSASSATACATPSTRGGLVDAPASRPSDGSERRPMNGTRLLGALLAVSSIALLVVAASTAAPTAKRGGTFVLEISTDVDYIDPQLSYYGETWKLEAATACKLMNWPDKEGTAGAVATPEVSAGLPVVSRDGKTYTFTIKPGFRFSNGSRERAELRGASTGSRTRACSRRACSSRHRAGRGVIDGEARTISGVRRGTSSSSG
jgi:hypothetical protein